MPYITEIEKDGDLNSALQNFNTICAANAATLGLTPAQLTEIAAGATGFNTTLNSATAAKATAEASVESKNIQKKASKAMVAKFAKIFRANAAVPDNLLDQLMLPHHKTPGTKTPPTTPLNLVANADGNGLVKLTWNRNGNRQSTQFLIEGRTSPTDDWAIIGGTTKASFSVQAVPGFYVGYRVSAQRNGQTSAPSTPVVLWDNGQQGQTLALAA